MKYRGKAVPDWAVSEDGLLFLKGSRLIALEKRKGRQRVHVPIEGHTKNLSVARLVIEAFWGVPCDAPYKVAYVNGDSDNTSSNNLRLLWKWKTWRAWVRENSKSRQDSDTLIPQ